MLRAQRNILLAVVLCFPLGALACSKPEPPPPTPSSSDDDDKPEKKKKKKKDKDPDEEDKGEVGAPTDEPGGGKATPPVGLGTAKPAPAGDAGGGSSAADKAKLAACCTALRNAAAAAGIASSVPSAIPGMPAPPPPPKKEEIEKAAKECDNAVNNWNGDLNSSLKKVKGASSAVLPAACMIAG